MYALVVWLSVYITAAFIMFLDVNIDVNTNFYLNMITALHVFLFFFSNGRRSLESLWKFVMEAGFKV